MTRADNIGLDDQIRDGYEYEMTLAFEIINDKHMARASKDRTGLFVNLPEFAITPEIGMMILNWCQSGEGTSADHITNRISECKSIQDVLTLYKMYPQYQQELKPELEQRKRELIIEKGHQQKPFATFALTKFLQN
jgi:hypothetical protein